MEVIEQRRAHNFKDLTGRRKGMLTVVQLDSSRTETKRIYWVCRCDCGLLKSIAASNLRENGKTVSCGCYQRFRSKQPRAARARRHTPEKRGEVEVLYSYKKRARKLGLTWELTDVDFFNFLSRNCHYCNRPPANYFTRTRVKNTHRYTSRVRYNGIDRKDNKAGYTLGNCVSCCATCNWNKGTSSYDEFRQWVTAVFNHWIGG